MSTESVPFSCIHNPRGWEKRVMGQERASTGAILQCILGGMRVGRRFAPYCEV